MSTGSGGSSETGGVAAQAATPFADGPEGSSANRAPSAAAIQPMNMSSKRSYVLFILMLVYVFNFLDRQILAILAEDIKADLGLSDSAMGFLLGTSFAVVYGTFGIALGKAADVASRKNVIAFSVSLWSLMTAASGLARSFLPLAVARMGVGVGEAGASPAVYSLICDIFPARLRTTALAFYSSGIFIGAGIGLFLGGYILTAWQSAYPVPAEAPGGLAAWQAAFMIVGFPGLLLALWVATLREPNRGSGDGVVVAPHRSPLRAVLLAFMTLIPPFNFAALFLAGGIAAVLKNLLIMALVVAGVESLIVLTGNVYQWVTLGVGVYCVSSWAQHLALSDQVAFGMIFRCRTVLLSNLGSVGVTFLVAVALGWLPVFFQRQYQARADEVGLVLGISYAAAGFAGVMVGGWVTDRLVAARGPAVRLRVIAIALAGAGLAIAMLVQAPLKWQAYALTIPFNFLSSACYGPAAANANCLVTPRIRATASATYIVFSVFLGTALGPYIVGAVSDMFIARGQSPGAAVAHGMLVALIALVPSILLLCVAATSVNKDEANRFERERRLGDV